MIVLIDRSRRVPTDGGPLYIDCESMNFRAEDLELRRMKSARRDDSTDLVGARVWHTMVIRHHELVCFAYSDDIDRVAHRLG
jgi:hypothetical protein